MTPKAPYKFRPYRDFTSRRAAQGEQAAQEWAASKGVNWNTLGQDERAELISRGVAEERKPKANGLRRTGDEAAEEIATWKAEAKAFGCRVTTVLHPDEIKPELAHQQRIEMARAASLDLLEEAFAKNPVLPERDIREIAARGLVVANSRQSHGRDAAADVGAIIDTYRTRGVRVAGALTRLDRVTDLDANGRQRAVYTTAASVEQEQRLDLTSLYDLLQSLDPKRFFEKRRPRYWAQNISLIYLRFCHLIRPASIVNWRGCPAMLCSIVASKWPHFSRISAFSHDISIC